MSPLLELKYFPKPLKTFSLLRMKARHMYACLLSLICVNMFAKKKNLWPPMRAIFNIYP